MAPGIKTSQTVVLVAAALCLTCACGIGYKEPPHPPPPPLAPISFHPDRLSFPDTVIGTSSPIQNLVISNDSPDVLALTGVEVAPFFDKAFRLVSTTCGVPLPAHSTCTAQVVFEPKTYLTYKKKPEPTSGILRVFVADHQVTTFYLKGTAIQTAKNPN